MKVYQKKFVQNIPITLEEAWDYFSSPGNLDTITPPDVYFKKTSTDPFEKMYPGLIITYRISPFFGLYLNWVTEITHIREQDYFVDEQRSGPFTFFHHQHHFKKTDSGVEMTDLLSYAVPIGWFGRVINALFVSGKLDKVFQFRREKIDQIFLKEK